MDITRDLHGAPCNFTWGLHVREMNLYRVCWRFHVIYMVLHGVPCKKCTYGVLQKLGQKNPYKTGKIGLDFNREALELIRPHIHTRGFNAPMHEAKTFDLVCSKLRLSSTRKSCFQNSESYINRKFYFCHRDLNTQIIVKQ